MKGDFSRFTFDPRKQYSGVRMQQGRVQLDADWNEQLDIARYLRRASLADLIGVTGSPQYYGGATLGGFQIDVGTGSLTISPGRYYVDGQLVENVGDANGDPLPINDQPYLIEADVPTLPGAGYTAGWYLAYLDAWTRHLTGLEDPDLLELALGGPDTATRIQTVWQVRLLRIDTVALGRDPICDDFPLPWAAPPVGLAEPMNGWAPVPTLPPMPLLAARNIGAPQQNQLYRVEVHDPGELDTATFKWSRQNGIFAARIADPTELTINIEQQIDQDQSEGFAAGQWIEVTDQQRLLAGEPGYFAQIDTVNGQTITVNGWPDAPGSNAPALPNDALIRRWDSQADLTVTHPGTNDDFLQLEDGVEIRFGNDTGAFYRTGDYWLIPSRTAAGVLWPTDGTGAPLDQEPNGIEHSYAPLGLVELTSAGWQGPPPATEVPSAQDCRRLFVPSIDSPGPEKLNRRGTDTFDGQLTVTDKLTVEGELEVGVAGSGGSSLTLIEAPLVPSTGDQADRGIAFPALGTDSGPGDASLRYSVAGSGEGKLRLAAANPAAALCLRQGGSDRVVITGGDIGVGTSTPTQDFHLGVASALLAPSTRLTVDVASSQLRILDGNQLDGKVLTSDDAGNATWQLLPDRQVGVPQFLDVLMLVASGSAAVGWTTYNIDASKVPSDAAAVIVQATARMGGPDSGDVTASIYFRKTANDQSYILLRGRASGSGDSIAWAGQGIYPISNGSIQYLVTNPGFGAWDIYIVGYFPS